MRYYKVQYFDKSYAIIDETQVEKVSQMKAKGKPFWLNHQSGRDFVDPRYIALITRAKWGEYTVSEPTTKALPATLSEEQRDKAAKRLDDIKQNAPWYKKIKRLDNVK